MDEILNKYFKLVYSHPLESDEYIRIIAVNESGVREEFVQTYDEFEQFICKFRSTHNIYNTISTVRGKESGEEKNLWKRDVICLDFDAKDFPDIEGADAHLKRIKGVLPQLFNHCTISSGSGGIHLYIAIKTTDDLDRVQKITKDLGEILSADPCALLKTQNLRPPRSLNHKHNPPRYVNVFRNEYGGKRYKPYTLDYLQGIISRYKRGIDLETKKPLIEKITKGFRLNTKHYPCIQKMLDDGTDRIEKTYRNFALCRIVALLKQRGYTIETTLATVLDWNQRKCEPPKPSKKVEQEVAAVWGKDYRLLGCVDKIKNQRHRSFLEQYCDRHTCNTATMCNHPADVDSVPATLRLCDIKTELLARLSGYAILILCILHRNENGLTYKQIEKEMMCGNKPCATEKTIRKALASMVGKQIAHDGGMYKIKSVHRDTGHIVFSYAICDLLINKLIKQSDFKVFICMKKCMNSGDSVNAERIAEKLRSDKSNVRKSIKNLEDVHAVKRYDADDERGLRVRRYLLAG